MEKGLLVNGINQKYLTAISGAENQIEHAIRFSYQHAANIFIQFFLRCKSKCAYKDAVKYVMELVKANPNLKVSAEAAIRDEIVQHYTADLPEDADSPRALHTTSRSPCQIVTAVTFQTTDPIYETADEEDYDTHFLYQKSLSTNNNVWKAKSINFKSDRQTPVVNFTHGTLPKTVYAYTVNRIVHLAEVSLPIDHSTKPSIVKFGITDGPLVGITLSDDGNFCALATSTFVIVYDFTLKTAKTHRVNHGDFGVISSIDFSAENICIGTLLGHVCVLDAWTGETVLQFPIPDIIPVFRIIVLDNDVIVQTLFRVFMYYTDQPGILQTDRILSIEATKEYLYVLTFDGIVAGYPRDKTKYEQFEVHHSKPFDIDHPMPWYRALTFVHHDDGNIHLYILYPDSTTKVIKKIISKKTK